MKKLKSSKTIENLVRAKVPDQKDRLDDYPFDDHLLSLSILYRRSRELYLKQGGKFVPTLVSSARTLSSNILLENTIEYSPLAREYYWAVLDPIEKRKGAVTTDLHRYISSVFHEQNHRLLWRLLPPAPKSEGALRRYLNFAESMVVVTDMALGDELGPALAGLFQKVGVVFDPGTRIKHDLKNEREYLNYLQVCLHVTYLGLEGYPPETIAQAVSFLFPYVRMPLLKRAFQRATRLNPGFIETTNPAWQRKHKRAVVKALSVSNGKALTLPDTPANNSEQYRIAEEWFAFLKLA